jgi:hypothetical protein
MDTNNLRPHIFIKNEPAAPVKREYDGGGGGTYPRESYKQHAIKVQSEAHKLRAIFANSKDKDISKRYFKVEIPEDHKVATSTGKILEKDLHSAIIGSPASNIAHVSTSQDSFEDLISQLDVYQSSEISRGKSKFATIESISEIPFNEKVSERFLLDFENELVEGDALITLFPDLDSTDVDSIFQGISKYLKENNGEVLSFLSREEGALLRVHSKKSILKDLAKMFVCFNSILRLC